MLVFGKKGRRAPYVLPVLTQLQLCLLILSSPQIFNKRKNIIAAFFFSDVAKD